MVSGIYKITSPSNKVYVGSSKNIDRRITYYKGLRCKQQTILYNSLMKYGWDAHLFEILEECDISVLLERERFYGLKYEVLTKDKGLNCYLPSEGEKAFEMCDESKRKRSERQKGKLNHFFGKTFSQESKDKRRETFYKNLTPERRSKIRDGQLNRVIKCSDESRLKMSKSQYGRKHTPETIAKMTEKNKNLKIVLNIETGIFYNGTKEAALSMNMNRHTLKNKLNNSKRNNTSFTYTL